MEHNEIKSIFEDDYEVSQEMRDQANEDMRFVVKAGGQWEGFLEDAYEHRAKMELDAVSPAVNRFMGEWVENEVMPKFKDEDTNDGEDLSDLIDSMFRKRWRKERGRLSAKNAVFEAAVCGTGAMRLGTAYVSDDDALDDRQDITFSPIFSAYSHVIWDSNSKEVDKSDANHVSIITPYTRRQFEKTYPDKTPSSATTPDDRRIFDWCSKNEVFVVEFYEKKEQKVTVHVYMDANGKRYDVEAKELEEMMPELQIQGYEFVSKRRVKKRYIEKSVINGEGFLESTRVIAGKILPVIPFFGHHAHVDGTEVYWGLTRKQKDPQRLRNMTISNLAEVASTSPKEAPIFDPEQVHGLERRWSEAHIGKKNYHLARSIKDATGNVTHAGPVGYLKPPQVDPSTIGLIDITGEHIRQTTGGMPQDIEDPDASGKAIHAVQKRVDMDTYTIMDNMTSAIRLVGDCYVSMANDILVDTRKVKTIAEDGTESESEINGVKVTPAGTVRTNSLQGRSFEVYASVGASYDSQRRESTEFMKELIQVLPEGDPRLSAVVSAIVDNMEGVGLDTIKKVNRKVMLLEGLKQPENEEDQQILLQAEEQNQQPQAMEQLVESQTALNYAEAEAKQATNIDKLASAEKKQAEAAKIIEDIGIDRMRLVLDALEKEKPRLN